jgi:hypothetical protein
MELRQIIAALEKDHDEQLCIVAKRPWTAQTEAQLVQLTEEFGVPPSILAAGYEYFLEVKTALEEVICTVGTLSPEQRVGALLYYAENDAYPEWFNELARRQ